MNDKKIFKQTLIMFLCSVLIFSVGFFIGDLNGMGMAGRTFYTTYTKTTYYPTHKIQEGYEDLTPQFVFNNKSTFLTCNNTKLKIDSTHIYCDEEFTYWKYCDESKTTRCPAYPKINKFIY